jgi:dihydroorotate dehydrogenase
LPAFNALINRMGFPNEGVERVAVRLALRERAGIVGVNIGKNAATPLDRAIDDYVFCLRAVYPVADYVTVNVSSPNTAGLRSLQGPEQLGPLLSALLEESRALETRYSRRVPLLLKLSPDSPDEELQKAGAVATSVPLAGIIATNSTLSRDGLSAEPLAQQAGGLSGRPLFEKSLRTVKILRATIGPTMPIVGVGGVASIADACLLREAGADFIQVYTGLVYQGPRLVRELADGL